MPNVKFSGFNAITSVGANGFLVGYDSVTNLNTRITLANLKSSLGVMNPTPGHIPYNNGGTYADSPFIFTSAGVGQAQELITYLPIGFFQNGLHLYNDPLIQSSAFYKLGHFDTSLNSDTYLKVVEYGLQTIHNSQVSGLDFELSSYRYRLGKINNTSGDSMYLALESDITYASGIFGLYYNLAPSGISFSYIQDNFWFGNRDLSSAIKFEAQGSPLSAFQIYSQLNGNKDGFYFQDNPGDQFLQFGYSTGVNGSLDYGIEVNKTGYIATFTQLGGQGLKLDFANGKYYLGDYIDKATILIDYNSGGNYIYSGLYDSLSTNFNCNGFFFDFLNNQYNFGVKPDALTSPNSTALVIAQYSIQSFIAGTNQGVIISGDPFSNIYEAAFGDLFNNKLRIYNDTSANVYEFGSLINNVKRGIYSIQDNNNSINTTQLGDIENNQNFLEVISDGGTANAQVVVHFGDKSIPDGLWLDWDVANSKRKAYFGSLNTNTNYIEIDINNTESILLNCTQPVRFADNGTNNMIYDYSPGSGNPLPTSVDLCLKVKINGVDYKIQLAQ